MSTYEENQPSHPSPVGSPTIVFVAVVLANVVAAAILSVLGSSTAGLITLVAGIVVGAGLALSRRRNDARSLQVRVDDAAVLIGRAAGDPPVPWGRVGACDVVELGERRRALVVMDDAAAGRLGNVATMPALLARVAALTGRAPGGASVVWLDTLPAPDALLAAIGESSGGRWPVAGAELTT